MIGQSLLDRYRIDTLLGQGATSDVYKAFDLILERDVAVKLLSRAITANDLAGERFLREARLTSRLFHPNIVSIFDFGVLDLQQPFLVTEYLDGPTLQDCLDEETDLAPTRSVHIFQHIAEGISHAHNAGIVHRDIKPSNVVLVSIGDDTDFAKIIDFGFLRVIAPGKEMQQMTQDGGMLGSAFYMSPEQCAGKQADERSDVYSMGCLMYECLTGKVPICGDNLLETLYMHRHTEVVPLSQTRSDDVVSPKLEALVMSCLEKDPESRPQTMRQIINVLADCEGRESAGTQPQKIDQVEKLISASSPELSPGSSSEGGSRSERASKSEQENTSGQESTAEHQSKNGLIEGKPIMCLRVILR